MTVENASTKGADKSIPNIKNMIESACLIPLREAMNNPTVRGSINNKTIPSYRSELYTALNPAQKSWLSNSIFDGRRESSLNAKNIIPMANISPYENKIRILFFLEMFAL